MPIRNHPMSLFSMTGHSRSRNPLMEIASIVDQVVDDGVRVAFDHSPAEGSRLPPHTVTMIPERLIGDYEIMGIEMLDGLASRLQNEVLRVLQRHYPTRTRDQLLAIEGALVMTNHENASHTYTAYVTVADIDFETFRSAFERATAAGSNPDLRIIDVDWMYWINPASLQRGRGSFKNPKGYNGLKNWDKKLARHPSIDLRTIGCAAIALANSLVLITKEYDRRRYNNSDYTIFVQRLQNRLEFKDPLAVRITEMQKIVELYPDSRLVVVESFNLRPFIYNGAEYVRNSRSSDDKTLFIYHDCDSDHYVSIQGYNAFMRSLKGTHITTCYECCGYSLPGSATSKCFCHSQDQQLVTVEEKKRQTCAQCNESFFVRRRSEHRCGETRCRFCQSFVKKGKSKSHRCPLIYDSKLMDGKFAFDDISTNELPKKPFELWAWDIESEIVYIKNSQNEFVIQEGYEKDEDGYFVTDADGRIKVDYIRKCKQQCNYIYCRNVFTGQELEFTCIYEFAKFTQIQNEGRNYFYAHNASGYDSRLLFEALTRETRNKVVPLMKGSKFMTLSVGDTKFHDSMLHLPGSLKRQGAAFNLQVSKGDFPHGFSFAENLDYEGPIPDIKYFPDRYKDKNELDEFKKWHAEMRANNYVWNYREERKKYCRNDVYMLAEILRLYHENCLSLFRNYPHLQVSPLFFPTVAGYHHKLQLKHLHVEKDLKNMSANELTEYASTTWCVLQPVEHYFAHKALRGGMTNICKFISKTNIHYVDIQSSYPNCQMAKENLYPVGAPQIEIHDPDYYPCLFHHNRKNCTESLERKMQQMVERVNCKLKIVRVEVDDIEAYCREFTGIITVDITPPTNLYHPLIQEWDNARNKVVGSLEPIKETTIPCIILKRAMDVGYIVTKIYRADRYKLQESIWRNGLLGDMYLAKMMYAGSIPEGDRQRMKDTFKEKFDIDLGDMSTWTNNPVRKHTSKILINCGWGKHAESVDHPLSDVYANGDVMGMELYENISENRCVIHSIQNIGEHTVFRYSDNRTRKDPDLHRTYLPAAVYVTAYGRLALWNELIKVDPPGTEKSKLRVLMYDTDSIVYECGSKEDYHIPEGDCLGDWETEKIESKGNGIKSFVSIGPKSYCVTPSTGPPLLKLKGAMLDHAHSKLINGDVMEEMVRQGTIVELPQVSLDYKIGSENALSFRNYRKIIKFNENDCKGIYNPEDFRVYPFGYQ